MSISALRRASAPKDSFKTNRQDAIAEVSSIDPDFNRDQSVFLKWQIELYNNIAKIIFVEKSRQIGFSWFISFRAVVHGFEGRSSVYTSYNRESTMQFIKDCKTWLKIFNKVALVTIKEEIIDERNDIKIFSIDFPNGESIVATAGNSENLRAKPRADIYIDEACYRKEPLEDILAASNAAIIHGGSIMVGSTHAGVDSEFNQICTSIKKGKNSMYSLHRIPFRTAVKQGLYKRICQREKIIWTPEKETIWIQEMYDLYGNRSSEELDAIPSDYSGGGKVFVKDSFKIIGEAEYLECVASDPASIYLRYHDLAASDSADAFYSASIRCAYDVNNHRLIIDDFSADQLDPSDATDQMIKVMERDNDFPNAFQIIEKEPGSSSLRYIEYLKNEMPEKNISSYQPKIAKLVRAIPAANAIAKGQIAMLDRTWSPKLIGLLGKFDGKKKIPLTNDLADCLSGIWDWFNIQFNSLV